MLAVPLNIEDDDIDLVEDSTRIMVSYEGQSAVISFIDGSGKEFLVINAARDTREVQIFCRDERTKLRQLCATLTNHPSFTGITCHSEQGEPQMICVADYLRKKISVDVWNPPVLCDGKTDL
jgi:hypothetical protein